MKELGPTEWLLTWLGVILFATAVTVAWAMARSKLDRLFSRPRSESAAGEQPDQRHHTGR